MANFVELCCRSGGSNVNPGTRTGSSTEPGFTADFIYTGTWSQVSYTFTVTGANPVTDGVTTNDFASLTVSGSTWALMGKVSVVSATVITIDSNKSTQTSPANGSTYTLRIGGAMAGPSGASGFPLNQALNLVTNAAGDTVRVNLKNDQTYSMTAAIAAVTNGPTQVHGYVSTYGDGGKATIAGPTTGSSITLLNTPVNCWLDSLIIKGNGATAAIQGVSAGNFSFFTRCVIRDMTGVGVTAPYAYFDECEIFNCCINASSSAAINSLSGNSLIVSNTVIHNNLGLGISTNATNFVVLNGCVIESNGGHGVSISSNAVAFIQGCDFYNNTGSGILLWLAVRPPIRNCNFLKNSGWGIAGAGGTAAALPVLNCGFGSGTMVNGSGNIQSTWVQEISRVTYPSGVTPWADPANGDFRIILPMAKGTGRGAFTQTASGYAGMVSYPDVGAAQHQDTSGSIYYSY